METNTRIMGVIGRVPPFTEWLGKTCRFFLEGVAYASDGISGFYPKGALPANAESDGRTWRIVADRRPIDMEY